MFSISVILHNYLKKVIDYYIHFVILSECMSVHEGLIPGRAGTGSGLVPCTTAQRTEKCTSSYDCCDHVTCSLLSHDYRRSGVCSGCVETHSAPLSTPL